MSLPFEDRVYFEDEMRSGTRTELKRRWGPKGHRPIAKVKIGYKFTYLYAALNPYNGHLVAMLMPSMTKDCFEIFMKHFAQEMKSKYGKKRVLIIADGATNHQESAIHSELVELVKLPTACPELNPAERFFEQLRTELSNKVFETIEAVELFLCKILKKYFNQPELIVSLTNFPYLRLQ